MNEFQKNNLNLQGTLKDMDVQLMVKDKELDSLKKVIDQQKVTINNNKKQVTRNIIELDNLTKKVITLDEKKH